MIYTDGAQNSNRTAGAWYNLHTGAVDAVRHKDGTGIKIAETKVINP